MRPKRNEPNSESISPHARFARMLEPKPFWPTTGGSCVVYWKSVGATPGTAVGETAPEFIDWGMGRL